MSAAADMVVQTVNHSIWLAENGMPAESFAVLEAAERLAAQGGVQHLWQHPALREVVCNHVNRLAGELADAGRDEESRQVLCWLVRFYPDDFFLFCNLGRLLNRQADHAGAARAYERAMRLGTRKEVAPEQLVLCLQGLAAAYYKGGSPEKAVAALAEALQGRRWPPEVRVQIEHVLAACRAGDAVFVTNARKEGHEPNTPEKFRADLLATLMDKGRDLLHQGLFAAAREAFARSLALARERGDRRAEAECFFELAGVHLETSQFPEAIQHYEQSAEICRELNDSRAYASRIHHAAQAFAALGQHAQAEALFAEVVEIADGLPDLEPARRIRYGMDLLHYRSGDQALQQRYRDTLAAFVREARGKVRTWEEATLAVQIGHEPLLESAAEFFRAAAATQWEARALLHLARVRLGMSRLEGARSAALSALLLVRTGNPYHTLQAYDLLADTHARGGRDDLAVDALAKAVDYGEQIRSAMRKDETREQFFQKIDHLYRRLVALLVKLDRGEEALTYAERTNARVLAEQLADIQPPPRLPESGPVARAYAEARAALDLLWTQAFRGEVNPRTFEPRRADLQRALDEATAQLFALDPEHGQHVTGFPPDWREARGALAAGQAYVLPFLVADGWVLFHVGAAGVGATHVAGDPEELAQLSRSFRATLARSVAGGESRDLGELGHEAEAEEAEAVLEPARNLYEKLVAPLEELLARANAITWVPDHALLELPVAALHDGRQFLAQRFAVSMGMSLGLEGILRRRMSDRALPERAVLVGNPDGTLPHAEEEVQAIGPELKCPVSLVGQQATLARLKELFAAAGLVHFACHAIFDERDATNSFLKLAERAGGVSDRLTVRDVYELRVPAALLVLSACQSGRVRAAVGNERQGFIRAALYAGAGSVLTALWPVSDQATKEFMKRFYGWSRQVDTAQALALAQRDMLAEGPSHPCFWAAFQLTGATALIDRLFQPG